MCSSPSQLTNSSGHGRDCGRSTFLAPIARKLTPFATGWVTQAWRNVDYEGRVRSNFGKVLFGFLLYRGPFVRRKDYAMLKHVAGIVFWRPVNFSVYRAFGRPLPKNCGMGCKVAQFFML